jgi:hypothetical protein
MDGDHHGHEDGEWPAHRRSVFWVIVLVALLSVGGGVLILGLTDRVLPAPRWVVSQIETRANAALAGQGHATVGGLELFVDDSFVPHVRLTDVELFSPKGVRIARLPDVRSTLDGGAILRGRLQPHSLTISGAEIALTRNADNSLDFALNQDAGPGAGALDPVAAIRAFDNVFELPVLSKIETIEISNLDLKFNDRRARKLWNAGGSWLQMLRTDAGVTVNLAVSVSEGGGAPARATVSLTSEKGSPAATLSADVNDVSSRDLAAQSPALAWLGALDAPISGSIWTSVDKTGAILPLHASLKLGKGALQPTPDTRPVGFDGVSLSLAYDPESHQLDFQDLRVDSPALRVRAEAKAWLKDIDNGVPNALVGQIAISDLKADPEGLFENPVALTQGAIDLKMTLAPFRIQLGQLSLMDGANRISAKGDFSAEKDGWAAAFDANVDAIKTARLLALWPVVMVPKTRDWLRENVATGDIFNVNAGLRVKPGQEPRFSLSYEYRAAEVTVIRTLPPVQDGAGYASISDNTYTLVVDKGHVTAPDGGRIDVAGSVMQIPDLRIVPAPAEVTLRTRSSVTAALSLLDQPPFGFLTKAGQPVDLAEGTADLETRLNLVLAARIRAEDVGYEVAGTLHDVRSDRIVKGKVITAGKLAVKADRTGIAIAGPGTFDGIPVDVTWRQGFGPEAKGKSEVTGTVELSPRALKAFSIALPEGTVTGGGTGAINLKLVKGKDTEFELTSDLTGLTLSVPEIGWSKPASQKGALTVAGALGQPARIDRLALSGADLAVEGKVILKQDGALDAIALDKASLGDWFEGGVVLRGRGKGQNVAVDVTSGRADIRNAEFGRGKASGETPITVALDSLRITSGIALTNFRGAFGTQGGFSGRFAARVNGDAPVNGSVTPKDGRSAFQITSDDAGTILRAAGLYRQGNGGTLNLLLDPAAKAGTYQGHLTVKAFRVTDAPSLAALLDAVSVVGLLTQLNGPGIFFSDASGEFYLTPDALEVQRASAIGPSMGISAAGIYDFASKGLDLRGTISPIYVLNGIGQIFSKRREGLFGFNYHLTGTSETPKIDVNPLSILTPGLFRDLFRVEPPKLQR